MRRSERDADLKQPSQPKKSKQNKTNEEGDNQRNDSINDQSKEYGIQHMYKCRERKREEREVIISSGNNSQIDGERREFKRLPSSGSNRFAKPTTRGGITGFLRN